MIILVRHAQSEGNKNRDIHQSIPDHRVKLTQEGQKQAQEAGRKLRGMLRPDDTLHFFTSPYRRTRETTEGILSTLTSDSPSPTPFPRKSINVYEEPRLREQDFGNFQPCSAAMERMWQERADYGHFFYRIPNGESAADAYDRVSGFNESLWRLFGDDDFASVCVLVTHGLMTRIFLMKWYHFSVEYFEDLRNVNHCEFVVMKKGADNGKYVLQNQLRTWSELEKEQEREWAAKQSGTKAIGDATITLDTPVPIRRKWGGCPDGCNHGLVKHGRKRPSRQNTADLFRDDEDAVDSGSPGNSYQQKKLLPPSETNKQPSSHTTATEDAARRRSGSKPQATITTTTNPHSTYSKPDPHHHHHSTEYSDSETRKITTHAHTHEELSHQRLSTLRADLGGRDGGGSESGMASRVCSDEEEDEQRSEESEEHATSADSHGRRRGAANNVDEEQRCPQCGLGHANVLGDGDDEEEEDAECDAESLEAEKVQDQSIRGSVY